MAKRFILISCLLGASAVIIGAFGAHILKKILSAADLQTYKTGVEYHFYHTFALLISAILSRYSNKKWTKIAGWCFILGIVLFSGSLYLLSMSYAFEIESINTVLGPLTPIGGLLFIAGWLSLFFAAIGYKDHTVRRSKRKTPSLKEGHIKN